MTSTFAFASYVARRLYNSRLLDWKKCLSWLRVFVRIWEAQSSQQRRSYRKVLRELRWRPTIYPVLDNGDTESFGSDEPLVNPKRCKRKPLHHKAVEYKPYENSEFDGESAVRAYQRRKLRRNRPAPGAMAEPPKDAQDVVQSDTDEHDERDPARFQRRNAQKDQQTSFSYDSNVKEQSHPGKMPDLFMEVDTKSKLEAILAQREKLTGRSQRNKSSKSANRDDCATR